jgi:hypothetical protein
LVACRCDKAMLWHIPIWASIRISYQGVRRTVLSATSCAFDILSRSSTATGRSITALGTNVSHSQRISHVLRARLLHSIPMMRQISEPCLSTAAPTFHGIIIRLVVMPSRQTTRCPVRQDQLSGILESGIVLWIHMFDEYPNLDRQAHLGSWQ